MGLRSEKRCTYSNKQQMDGGVGLIRTSEKISLGFFDYECTTRTNLVVGKHMFAHAAADCNIPTVPENETIPDSVRRVTVHFECFERYWARRMSWCFRCIDR